MTTIGRVLLVDGCQITMVMVKESVMKCTVWLTLKRHGQCKIEKVSS